MRILTIGAKTTINGALASCADLDLVAMLPPGATASENYPALPYDRGKKLSLQSILQVRRAIQEWQPDLVHAFYPRPLAHAVLAAASLGSRMPIVSFRGVTSVPRWWSPEHWLTYLSPRVAAHACESRAVADSLIAAGVPNERCHVVHNCLGDVPMSLSRAAARGELGLADDAFVVMMIANMRRVKGADLLIRAALACRALPNLQVVAIGRVQDPLVKKLARDPRLAGVVHLTGHRPHAARLLAAADLFVMPSRAEALSVALLEAMTQGVCPVVSSAGGMKEAVRHEIDGVVFPSENSEALATAVTRLHADQKLRAELARSAQVRAQQHFSAEQTAKRLVAMYDIVAAGPPRASIESAA